MKSKYLFRSLAVILFIVGLLSCNNEEDKGFPATVKVALRNVGHQLLLTNNDSGSLVKPIQNLDDGTYQLAFEKELSIKPDSLVSIIKYNLKKANLPSNYLTEVIQCKGKQVAYSYKMNLNVEKGIIPCAQRILPKACYLIQISFSKPLKETLGNFTLLTYLIFFTVLIVLIVLVSKLLMNKKVALKDSNYAAIGMYKFYPEQNKLIKEATEISLSKKECELLAIFVAQPNQIIKRDELTKKVWEDNGVIVGRSLDTYISKLRKKLKDDDSIKLTNVHGVGYKLEV